MLATERKYISLNEAAKLFPGRPHLSSVHRWADRGIRGVKLASIRVGVKRYTTEEDIREFLAATNQSDDDQLAAEGC